MKRELLAAHIGQGRCEKAYLPHLVAVGESIRRYKMEKRKGTVE
jgi:hypothetical protein